MRLSVTAEGDSKPILELAIGDKSVQMLQEEFVELGDWLKERK